MAATLLDDASDSQPQRPPPPQCAMCRSQPSKYTCPGCSMKTCSAACSSSHKTKTGCTGQRDKAAYVPLTKYTWGTMMDDYVFLEDVGRKVGEAGKEIVRGGYMANASQNRRGGGMRGRGGMRRGGGSGGPGKSKRDILKMQLDVRDIDMEVLPLGMERRKANQSTWDFRNQTALLTIEFKLHKPIDPLAPSSHPRDPPLVLLTHRNDMQKSLISLLRSHIPQHGNNNQKSKRDQNQPNTATKSIAGPPWTRALLYPDPDDPNAFKMPHCVMHAPLDPKAKAARKRAKKAANIPNPIFPNFAQTLPSTTTSSSTAPSIPLSYYSLDATKPLDFLLKHKQFVEFPTIEVWEEFSEGVLVDDDGIPVDGTMVDEEEHWDSGRVVKKRKLDPAAMQGLLGAYGSDEDEDEDEDKDEPAVSKPPAQTLSALANYADSDGEGGDDDALVMSDDEEGEVDPKLLLELLKQARNDVTLAGGSLDDEDAVDWGDMDAEGEDDLEAELL